MAILTDNRENRKDITGFAINLYKLLLSHEIDFKNFDQTLKNLT